MATMVADLEEQPMSETAEGHPMYAWVVSLPQIELSLLAVAVAVAELVVLQIGQEVTADQEVDFLE